jgi:glycyl-tRNA synthetase beta chain
MSRRDLLIEIGTEEIPARFIAGAASQLQEKTAKWLDVNRVSYESIDVYEAPRRFAVNVKAVSEKQQDINLEAKGPAKKIALDEQGEWTKAAIGFARGQQTDPADLYFKELNGIEYVFARRSEQGGPTETLLPQLKDVISGLSFPKNMRWGANELRFVRPIRWMIALFGIEIISIELAGVSSSNVTYGHRFLGTQTVVSNPNEYKEILRKQFVIVDPQERREMIVQQLKELEHKNGWSIPVDEDLLDEVVHLVDYPTALSGSFEPEYLTIPEEVLITSMKEHQRYFPVRDMQGDLLPFFITVRNGDERALETVARGNEKVLRARLSDARFFYEEDQKLKISHALSKLENVVFHEELGTIGDKVRRIRDISGGLAEKLGLDDETKILIDRTAEICKFDLVSQMVYEFPELQGIMGERYARLAGEDERVAVGVFEHYLPRNATDRLPETTTGAIVSLADKMDTIVGCFSIGIVPTGSQDPYALRRQAAGIVHILLDRGLPFELEDLFSHGLQSFVQKQQTKREPDEITKDLFDFFGLRLKNLLQDKGVRYDVVDAVLDSGFSNVSTTVKKAEALMDKVSEADFKGVVESFNRVYNLSQKLERESNVDPSLFENESENNLYDSLEAVKKEVKDPYTSGNMEKVLAVISSLKSAIDNFFDSVMVMAENISVRNNRLSLLAEITALVHSYANFSKLVFA